VSRGRPRVFRDSIPSHIDQAKIPRGCFWDERDSNWYVIHRLPKAKRQRIAGAEATLADLHRLMEDIAGVARGTVGWLLEQYHASPAFKACAPSTRKHYEKYQRVVLMRKTRVGMLHTLKTSGITPGAMRNLIDSVAAEGKPTKANHLLRYLRMAFAWGLERDLCASNPCAGLKQVTERAERIMPTHAAQATLLAFCAERGSFVEHRKGAVAPYLWPAMELAYLCRLRGAELLLLTDASAKAEGVLCKRLKGSRTNLVAWSPRLRAAWDAAVARRTDVWSRRSTPVPMRAEDRPLFVGQSGARLRKGAIDSAWQAMILLALEQCTITAEDRFSLHGLKRRGITDTPGTGEEKQLASGHKSKAMLDVYDQSVPVVKPAGER
jgi:hypothetical protein